LEDKKVAIGNLRALVSDPTVIFPPCLTPGLTSGLGDVIDGDLVRVTTAASHDKGRLHGVALDPSVHDGQPPTGTSIVLIL
jgi:hypothetical protein